MGPLHTDAGGRPAPQQPTPRYRHSGKEVYLAGFQVDSITSTGALHVCGHTCFGLEHEVRVTSKLATVAPDGHVLGKFDVIIVRHDADQCSLFAAIPVSEQLTLFDRPA